MLKKIFKLTYKLAEILPSLRLALVASMGLGLGLGMSLVVFQNPQSSFASPVVIQPEVRLLTAKQLEINNEAVQVCQDHQDCKIIEEKNSQGLAKGQVILEIKDAKLIAQLEQVKLGDELNLVGSNNGRYSYEIIESRLADSETLSVLLELHDNGLILFAKKGLTKSQLVFVAAK